MANNTLNLAAEEHYTPYQNPPPCIINIVKLIKWRCEHDEFVIMKGKEHEQIEFKNINDIL